MLLTHWADKSSQSSHAGPKTISVIIIWSRFVMPSKSNLAACFKSRLAISWAWQFGIIWHFSLAWQLIFKRLRCFYNTM